MGMFKIDRMREFDNFQKGWVDYPVPLSEIVGPLSTHWAFKSQILFLNYGLLNGD